MMVNESKRKPRGGGLFAEERRQRILSAVESRQRATVEALAAQFKVSPVTIRTDLDWLERQGLIRRTHGGAVPADPGRVDPAFAAREGAQRAEKERIGAAAAALVQDGDTIGLDASTTALHLARNLRGKREITVVTNGLRVAQEIAQQPGLTVMLLGGLIRPEAMSVVGSWGEAVLDRINIGKVFVGARGFTLAEGLTDVDGEEVRLKQALVAVAHEVVAVIDQTKWGQVGFATFCALERIQRIITVRAAPTRLVQQARRRGLTVTLV